MRYEVLITDGGFRRSRPDYGLYPASRERGYRPKAVGGVTRHEEPIHIRSYFRIITVDQFAGFVQVFHIRHWARKPIATDELEELMEETGESYGPPGE